jgi:hypothetical protein
MISDAATPGRGAVVQGTYQAPILVQWRPATNATRNVDVTISRFE